MTIFKKSEEEKLTNIEFNIHKFSDKPKPKDPSKIIIFGCFSEFGCEIIGSMYCIPRLIEENPNHYYIAMGWYGREYLYRHLVDEFWEAKEKFQWLRDKCLAFHHCSRNLARIEKVIKDFGKFKGSQDLGKIAVGNKCHQCGEYWGQITEVDRCRKCGSLHVTKSLFSDIPYWKKRRTPIPKPSEEKLEKAKGYLGNNPVGIIARSRKTYGRNLQPEFYVELIGLLESMGYTPIWLGEKQTTLECPVPHIVDLTRKPEARDLELTLAVVCNLEFTVQFWTASTRLSAIMGAPYLLFESPDQLFGAGQEAYRLALCTMGKSKLVLSHYLNVYNDNEGAIKLAEKSINEMREGNWQDVIGMVDKPDAVSLVRAKNLRRLGRHVN